VIPNQYFVLEYDWKKDKLPVRLSGSFNQPEFEWDILNPNSAKQVRVQKSYELKITDKSIKKIEADFYDPDCPIVSERFLSICDELGVSYQKVPLKISFTSKNAAPHDSYLLLLCDSAKLLDREHSEFGEDHIVETGAVMMNKHFPDSPIYSWIRKFKVRSTQHHLFHCIELIRPVVSQKFKQMAEERNLKGLSFVPVDNGYQYDPWGDMP
jgi:hypothetical protein